MKILRKKKNSYDAVSHNQFGGLSLKAIQISLHQNNKDNCEIIEHIKNMSIDLGSEVLKRQLRLQRHLPTLYSNSHPVLIIASFHDELRTLTEAKELQKKFDGSTLKIIERGGHMLPLEQPDLIADLIISWLNNRVFDSA